MRRLIVSGIVIFLLLLSFQYYVVLKNQVALPSEDWSRAYSLDLSSTKYNQIQSMASEDGYTISLTDLRNNLTVVSCDADMACEFERKIEKVKTYRNTWSNKANSYYIKNEQLIQWEEGKETVIAEPVKDFVVADDQLVYWTEENEAYILNHDSLTVIATFTAEQQIHSIETHGSQLFVVLKNLNGSTYTVNLYNGELTKLYDFPVRSAEALLDVKIVEEQGYHLLIQKQVTEGGGKTISYYTAPFDESKPNQSISLHKLKFIDKESDLKLFDVINSSLFYTKKSPMLTFSAALYDSYGNKVHKIFTGEFDSETIEATAVTKMGERYSRPVQISDDEILFFRLDGKNMYLSYASSKEEKIHESSGILEGDYKESIYQLITLMSKGILLLLLSFLWLLPGLGLVYGAKGILGRFQRKVPYKSLLFFYLISLLGFQAIAFMKIMNYEVIVDLIPYISTTAQFIGLIVLSMVITLIPIVLLRTKYIEDHFGSNLLFISVMNLAVLFVLIGPYMV